MLARQFDDGAGANIFGSADDAWVNWAIDRHLIDTAPRRAAVSARLVLIVPKEKPAKKHPQQIDIKPGFDLSALLGRTGRPAIGDPAHALAGRHAIGGLLASEWVSRRLRVSVGR
jgi:molybdate transport system substrate-binding protein